MPRALQRRKVRRGTQNCWECKRRKIRCTYALPTESVCDGCKSRRLRCISQRFYEAETRDAEGAAEAGSRSENAAGGATMRRPSSARLRSLMPRATLSTDTTSQQMQNITAQALLEARSGGSPPDVEGKSRYTGLCRDLLSVWPAQADLDTILSIPVSTSILFHGVVCAPYSSLLNRDNPSAREIFQLTPKDAHPVLVARKLLLLATFLQGIPRAHFKDLGSFDARHVDTMSSLVVAARRVTSDDGLIGSLEGIECIMMESMYYNNAGNIRRAWTTHRRAVTMAQLLGLHRPPSTTTKPPMLDVESGLRIHPQHMWYRLIITDRYLSLMLGLPQHSIESPFPFPSALDACTPLERLERMESIAGGLIMERNRIGEQNPAQTEKIDMLLQEAAGLMPVSWWLAPDTAAVVDNGSEALGATLRLMNQFTHYHLLAQLHLPYLLKPSGDDRKYAYSKLTAVMASREILSRFVAFRNSDSVAAYCRGIDFLAFIASTVLALAHIDACRQQRADISAGLSAGARGSLSHQRPGDRGLLEKTFHCVEERSEGRFGSDALACRIACVLRQLLAIEAKSAVGAHCTTSVAFQPAEPGEPGEIDPHLDGQGADQDELLHIRIPYFGTIKVHLNSVKGAEQPLLKLQRSCPFGLSSAQTTGDDHGDICFDDTASSRAVVQRVDNLQVTLSQQHTAADPPTDGDYTLCGPDATGPDVPALAESICDAAVVDNWSALQGVDIVLFDCLIRGVLGPAAGSTPADGAVVSRAKAPDGSPDADVTFENALGFPPLMKDS